MAKKRTKHAKRVRDEASSSLSTADLLTAFFREVDASPKRYWDLKIDDFQTTKTILSLPPEELAEFTMALLEVPSRSSGHYNVLYQLGNRLYRRKLPFRPEHVDRVSAAIEAASGKHTAVSGTLLTIVENSLAYQPLSDKATDLLKRAVKKSRSNNPEHRKVLKRLRQLVGVMDEPNIKAGEAWSDAALAELARLRSEKKRSAWYALLVHCQECDGAKPKADWTNKAKALLKGVGVADFLKRVPSWFLLVDKPRTQEADGSGDWRADANLMLDPANAVILKGLVWCCTVANNDDVVRTLTPLALTAYKKVPGVGPRAVSLGNACVYALGTVDGMEGVAQLAILKVRVKFGLAQNGIEKALVASAERIGLPREELEEISVPAYGLTEVGRHLEQLADVTAELVVAGRRPELRWTRSDGKVQKSIPASVKKSFADELKQLKQSVKDIEKMLPAQVGRIERSYLEQREWTFPVWKERYLEHPLVGAISRRLIWFFRSGRKRGAGLWTESGMTDSRGKPLDWLDDSTRVQLWHPLHERRVDRISEWRERLLDEEIRQPFKQAHRETYVLTDAERSTRVYSNRFAAHVLKQHQFHALCGNRLWKNRLRLMVDDAYPPAHVVLPQWKLRAEFWVEGAGDTYGVHTTESGTYHYLATDQVRFYEDEAAQNSAHASGGGYVSNGMDTEINEPLELEQIPPLVFSEVMRDVDLFVGVSSVGNDPNWSDGGPDGQFRYYWEGFSFGELGATAQTRKAVLERLVPRLKIADRCTFSERFLIVRGDLRTYRIHLGSGNILMEPNDEYLCIVPKQSVEKSTDTIFLPFEGDRTLSIILSKALMLADDTRIKDPTIVSQIR